MIMRCLFFFFFALFSFSLPIPLSFSLFLSFFASFFSVLFLLFPSHSLFLSRPSLTIELNQRWNTTSAVLELRYLKFSSAS